MKDGMKHCQHALSNDVVYKEVVVIGNGPSGMVTSFMLAGNVPHLKEVPQDLPIDEMLRARLSNLPADQNLYETDLMELAEGLEGRSQNPIPILMDNLLRPCADLGMQADPLIEWKFDIDKQIDHIVLGRGPPGGAWHTFPATVRTLSPGAWLALPPHAAACAGRLSAGAVAKYCRRYVLACGLQRYFRNGVIVRRVSRAPRAPAPPCGANCPLNAKFIVDGYDKSDCRPFRYACRRIVIACGGNDRPNTLEPHVATHALHSLAAIERGIHLLSSQAVCPTPPSVLVVGSGVSAADAVWLSLRAGLKTVHLHRTPAEALVRLSPQTYPDYCQVYKMMCDGQSGDYPNYKSYPNHIIVDVTPDPNNTELSPKLNTAELEDDALCLKRVKLLNTVTNEVTDIEVSLIVVLIGSKPDLFFLQTNFNLNSIDIRDCIKCKDETRHATKRKIENENRNQCFLKHHWHYFKSVLGQSIQSCKSRYLNYTEINGNTDTKCVIPKCNRQFSEKTRFVSNIENGESCKCKIIPCYNPLETRIKCQCRPCACSNGIGFGLDPKKPVDCRSNPVGIDKSTHELLNGPKGMYALGPLTADNFVRFIPGGALAIVSHIHKQHKITE